ncbi:hypothetical protein COU37_05005 [Candidatus Micrarchaeota archaeon CG10_big_fil_rev_8_21_14_0_10_45_29]|nr:MAG: hypothetical protein COU37_05005 [Candidatus Micrarchaeota archaeon CG10_big_fil_rev_8_21_14_0_10_45_29]
MKWLIALLLLLGSAFAIQFPNELPAAGVNLLEVQFEDGIEYGYYASEGNQVVLIIGVEDMGADEWAQIEEEYISNNLAKRVDIDTTYYYICEESDEDMKCFMDAYSGGKYYTIDISNLDIDQSATLSIGTKAGRGIMGKSGGGMGPVCAPPAIAMLALAALAIRRK